MSAIKKISVDSELYNIEDSRVDNIAEQIPDASTETKGLVQIGEGITVSDGVISVDAALPIEVVPEYEGGTLIATISQGENEWLIYAPQGGQGDTVTYSAAQQTGTTKLLGTLTINNVPYYINEEAVMVSDTLNAGTTIATITCGNQSWTIKAPAETDPIFLASPAANISAADITAWNNKSDFSGNYNDLTNKPVIPTATSNLVNDSGFITSAQAGDTVSYNQTLGSGVQIGTITINGDTTTIYAPSGGSPSGGDTVSWSGNYTSSTGTQIGTLTISGVNNPIYGPNPGDTVAYSASVATGTALGTLTIDGTQHTIYAPTVPSNVGAFTNDAGYVTSADVSMQMANELAGVAFTGSYENIMDAPEDLSDFNNDTGFITSAALSGYVTSADVATQMQNTLAAVAFDGEYKSLTDAPEELSNFANDVGYITSAALADYVTSADTADFITSADIAVTQVQSAGTKIATITVDNTSTDLYAPTGGGGGGDTVTYTNSAYTGVSGTRPSIGTISINSVDVGVTMPPVETFIQTGSWTSAKQQGFRIGNNNYYLDAPVEEDPVFTASPAHDLTSADVARVQGKDEFIVMYSTASFQLQITPGTTHWNGTLYRSNNSGYNWMEIPNGTTTTIDSINYSQGIWLDGVKKVGYAVILCGEGNTKIIGDDDTTFTYIGNSPVEIYGNIHALLDKKVSKVTKITGYKAFKGLFKNWQYLTKAPEISAVTIDATYPYAEMFSGCTSLTQAPELPSTEILTSQSSIYYKMFEGCTNLVKGPSVLPAKNVPTFAYARMFYNCINLKEAPEILAEQVENNSCEYMFYNCQNMEKAPYILKPMVLAQDCYKGMFDYCTALKIPPILPATTLATSCYENMFAACTALQNLPELPATTLSNRCYYQMFLGTPLRMRTSSTTNYTTKYRIPSVTGTVTTGTDSLTNFTYSTDTPAQLFTPSVSTDYYINTGIVTADDDGSVIQAKGCYIYPDGITYLQDDIYQNSTKAVTGNAVYKAIQANAGANWTATTGQAGYISNKPSIESGTGTGAVIIGNPNTIATGTYSVSEGNGQAKNTYAHAEGDAANATGYGSHAEGLMCTAQGSYSHAEGGFARAVSSCSHAEGEDTEIRTNAGHVQGKYNVIDNNGILLDIVGNGTDNARSNAEATDINGNKYIAGGLWLRNTAWTTTSAGVAANGLRVDYLDTLVVDPEETYPEDSYGILASYQNLWWDDSGEAWVVDKNYTNWYTAENLVDNGLSKLPACYVNGGTYYEECNHIQRAPYDGDGGTWVLKAFCYIDYYEDDGSGNWMPVYAMKYEWVKESDTTPWDEPYPEEDPPSAGGGDEPDPEDPGDEPDPEEPDPEEEPIEEDPEGE